MQALCGKPLGSGRGINKFATDRISTRTLNSVLTHDPASVEIAKWFSKDYNLTWGQNLVKKYFDMIGLHNWMDERQEVSFQSYDDLGCIPYQLPTSFKLDPQKARVTDLITWAGRLKANQLAGCPVDTS